MDGKFIAAWGTEGSGNGQFKTLHDVTVDPSGKFVYTLELGNYHRIQKFTADGEFISRWAYEDVYLPDKDGMPQCSSSIAMATSFQNGALNGTRDGQFNTPHGVAIDPQNNVFVTDMDNSRVQEFNSDGVFLLKVGFPGFREWSVFKSYTWH